MQGGVCGDYKPTTVPRCVGIAASLVILGSAHLILVLVKFLLGDPESGKRGGTVGRVFRVWLGVTLHCLEPSRVESGKSESFGWRYGRPLYFACGRLLRF
ncbi:hypothetical protein NEOLEDRAFT_1143932, partial [Neolentinus lepideus HHB14362 ss-1]